MPSTSRHNSRSTSAASSSEASSLSRSSSSMRKGKERLTRHDQKKVKNLLTNHKYSSTAIGPHRKHTKNTSMVISKNEKEKAKDEQHRIETMDVDDFEVIDLCTPVNETTTTAAAVLSLVNDVNQMSVAASTTAAATITTSTSSTKNGSRDDAKSNQAFSTSHTLRSGSKRWSILPAFPAASDIEQPDLLLANVPIHQLSEKERQRRGSMKYRPPFHVIGGVPTSILVNTHIPSFFWPLYKALYGDVAEHLRLDLAIIDYNYARLSQCVDIWAKDFVRRSKKETDDMTLAQYEYPIALEFFLQIDVDMFYMKTCSFRGAKQDQSNKFLFCMREPQARYGTTACENCGLCYPKYDVKKRRQPSVQFGPAQRHQFVNKYEAILNCPTTCHTWNIIYVLTCPCGKFDYIGETSRSLADRVKDHRYHGNRIMHECFIGHKNVKLAYPNVVKLNETLSKDDMHLYRHSTECPFAIQIFLDENPRYWRFVPFLNDEADQVAQDHTIVSRDIVDKDEVRSDEEVKTFLGNLVPPPQKYRFTSRQCHQQYSFFQTKKDHILPNMHLDLYNAKVIAVLPENASAVLRQVVEALFITHTEAKLNSAGRLVACNDNNNHASNNECHPVWCEGLVRRPIPMFSKTSEMNKTMAGGR